MLTMKQKTALSHLLVKKYRSSSKKEKGQILNDFMTESGYNRNYASKLFNGTVTKKKGRKKKYQRAKCYDGAVYFKLKRLWAIADGICGKRLAPFLPELIEILESHNEIGLDPVVRKKLLKISAATVDRLLANTKKGCGFKGKSTTKPGTLLKKAIPIRTFADWNENKAGFFEADLVSSCGDNVKGDFVNCLDMVDVKISWVGLAAFMGKSELFTHQAIDEFKQRLIYALLGLDSDNGSEFINYHLLSYCKEKKITFTRGRSNHKNDGCFVEQKNYSVVRRFLGYARYDTKQQLEIIQQVLPLVEIYVNFFQPVLKLKKKTRIGAKQKRKYDKAKTPYQRLLAENILTKAQKQKLQDIYKNSNPVKLKRQIYYLQRKLQKTLKPK